MVSNQVPLPAGLTTIWRGGAVTANFFDRDGKAIDHRLIEQKARDHPHGIKVRLVDGRVGRVKEICDQADTGS